MEYITLVQPLVKAAGTAGRVSFAPSDAISGEKWKLLKVRLEPNTTSATNGTNFGSLTAYVGTTAVSAARTTAAVSLTAGTGEDLALTGIGSSLEVDGTNEFSVRLTHDGSGVAVDCSVIATFKPDRY